ncbi:MAG: AAA family ATPase [Metallibacterium scheffleri]
MDHGPVRRFKINKLHGYKDVEIVFSGPVLILIAGNGSGKTTILNALHAFLRRRFNRLKALEFASIECEFSNNNEVIRLNKSQVTARDAGVSERLSKLAEISSVSEDDIYDFLSSTYMPNQSILSYRNHPVVRGIYDASPWGYEEINERFSEIHGLIGGTESIELRDIGDKVARAIQGIEIVYLPTYRRIENPMLSPRGRRRGSMPRRRLAYDGQTAYEPAQMNYGLEDVEARLEEVSVEVERISNLEYRNASATIIDEALANSITFTSVRPDELPDLMSLKRFLLRVSRADKYDFVYPEARESEARGRESRASESRASSRIEAIQKLYETGKINDPDQNVLRYFLSRLGSVIGKTKETEARLQRFVEACNGYLVDSSDEKSFVYEPNSMRVTVVNKFTDTIVPLGQLSSGEKQVISMLAGLYLNDKKNIILIDEPELSLSLDWQRKIIPDMMNSGSVAQLLAITHSPFIFENDLDPFAGAMKITRHKGLAS